MEANPFILEILIQKLGWTLIHFLWQGAVVAALAEALFFLLRNRSAASRYWAACLIFFGMVALPVVTFRGVHVETPRIVEFQESISRIVAPSPSAPAPSPPAVPSAPLLEVSLTEPAPAPPASGVPWHERVASMVQPHLPLMVGVWIVGVIALSLRHLFGWVLVQRMKRRCLDPIGERIRQQAADLADRIRISRPVRVFQSSLAAAPLTIGWIRPMILLPASALSGLSSAQLEAILAHELAHIRRFDYPINLFQTLVETLLFYHPAVWWLSKRIRIERENCCDDIAVEVCGDPVAYAKALAEVADLQTRPALAIGMGDGSLIDRVRRLVGRSREEEARSSAGWASGMLAVVLVGGLLAVGMSGAEDSATTSVEKERTWIVQGKVTDAEGKPLSGVNISANCGMGTMFLTGRTTSNDDGSYELEFRPGVQYDKDLPPRAGFQFASIFAKSPDLVEQNLCRDGALRMAYAMPDRLPEWVTPEIVVLPNQPYHLDFVMVPAVTIRGRVVDLEGEPIRGISIWIDSEIVPPSAGLLASSAMDKNGRVFLDENGKFEFTGLPTCEMWLQLRTGERNSVVSKPLDFDQPGEYEVEAILLEEEEGLTWSITSRPEPPGKWVGQNPIQHIGPSPDGNFTFDPERSPIKNIVPPTGSDFNFVLDSNGVPHYTYAGPKDASAPIRIWFKEENNYDPKRKPDLYVWADEIQWNAGIQSGTAMGNVIIDNTSEYRIESSYVEYDHEVSQAFFPRGATIIERLADGPDNKIVAGSALVTFDQNGIKSAKFDRFLNVGETRLQWERRAEALPNPSTSTILQPEDLLGRWIGGGGILPVFHTFEEGGVYRSEMGFATGTTDLHEGTWVLKGDRLIRGASEELEARIVDFKGDSFIVEYKDGERWGYRRTMYERVGDEEKEEQTGRVEGQVFIGDEPVECKVMYVCYAPEGGPVAQRPIETNSEGRFTMKDLPPGKYQFSRLVEYVIKNEGGWTSNFTGTHGATAEVVAGATVSIRIGGMGRTIRGQVVAKPNEEGEEFSIGSLESRTMHRMTGRYSPFGVVLDFDEDGAFEIPDVLPGTYQTHFSSLPKFGESDRNVEAAPNTIVIPEATPESPEVYDLGEIEVRLAPDRKPQKEEKKPDAKTGAVQGRVIIDGKLWTHKKITYNKYYPDSDLPFVQPTRTDSEGHFKVKDLPPGKYHFAILKDYEVKYQVNTDIYRSHAGTHSHGVYIDVVAGETTEIQIGGSGRKVVGKLVPTPNGEGESPSPVAFESRFLYGEAPRPKDMQGHIPGDVWILDVKEDGSFEIPDMRPGDYKAMFRQRMHTEDPGGRPWRDVLTQPQEFHIPEATPGSPEVYDLGEIEVRLGRRLN